MLFVSGFKELMNIENGYISMAYLNELYEDHTKQFINEYHDKTLHYLYTHNYNLASLSSSLILKIPVKDCLMLSNVKVYSNDDKGNLTAIIGHLKMDESLRNSKIVQYNLCGEGNKDFYLK